MIFYVPIEILGMRRSSCLTLFPDEWQNLQEPTEGFKLLCHALAFNLPSEWTVEVEYQSQIIRCIGKKILVDDPVCTVAVVNLPVGDCLEEFVVKVAKGRYAKGIVTHFELFSYKKISEIEGVSEYIVRLRSEFQVKYGFVMEYAAQETISTWIESSRFSTAELRDNALKPMFRHIFKGLKLLHHNGWYHRDIRPGNIVISNDGFPKLIDWATAIQGEVPEDSPVFYQGHSDPFWPDNIALARQPEKWDLVAFGLVICYLTLPTDECGAAFKDLSLRKMHLSGYLTNNPTSLAAVGVHIYLECSKELVAVDYDALEALLT
jgi:serine/threonine protein kinase